MATLRDQLRALREEHNSGRITEAEFARRWNALIDEDAKETAARLYSQKQKQAQARRTQKAAPKPASKPASKPAGRTSAPKPAVGRTEVSGKLTPPLAYSSNNPAADYYAGMATAPEVSGKLTPPLAYSSNNPAADYYAGMEPVRTTPEALRDYAYDSGMSYDEIGSDPDLIRDIVEGTVGRNVTSDDVAQVASEALWPTMFMPMGAARKAAEEGGVTLANVARGSYSAGGRNVARGSYSGGRAVPEPHMQWLMREGNPPAMPNSPHMQWLARRGEAAVPAAPAPAPAPAIPAAPATTAPARAARSTNVSRRPAPQPQQTVRQPVQQTTMNPADEAMIRSMIRNWRNTGEIKPAPVMNPADETMIRSMVRNWRNTGEILPVNPKPVVNPAPVMNPADEAMIRSMIRNWRNTGEIL